MGVHGCSHNFPQQSHVPNRCHIILNFVKLVAHNLVERCNTGQTTDNHCKTVSVVSVATTTASSFVFIIDCLFVCLFDYLLVVTHNYQLSRGNATVGDEDGRIRTKLIRNGRDEESVPPGSA